MVAKVDVWREGPPPPFFSPRAEANTVRGMRMGLSTPSAKPSTREEESPPSWKSPLSGPSRGPSSASRALRGESKDSGLSRSLDPLAAAEGYAGVDTSSSRLLDDKDNDADDDDADDDDGNDDAEDDDDDEAVGTDGNGNSNGVERGGTEERREVWARFKTPASGCCEFSSSDARSSAV